jgi:hypothetical protein
MTIGKRGVLAGAWVFLFASIAAPPAGAQTAGWTAATVRLVAPRLESPALKAERAAGRAPETDASARRETEPPARRECEGCPARHPRLAVLEVVGINALYNAVNQLLPWDKPEDFDVSPATWSANLRHGFSWDNDEFVINQFGHPYQGANYFTAGRSMGLSYWESLPLAGFGSVTWEFFGERTRPAWNDVINTTLGGAAIGEALHRLAWLVRDPRLSGAGRIARELAALGVEPISGLNRFASGAAMRPDVSPSRFRPLGLAGSVTVGSTWRRDPADRTVSRTGTFGTFAIDYDRLERGPAREPFDAFTLTARVGSGSLLSDASIRGRLAGWRLGRRDPAAHQFVLVQGFDYQENPLLLTGGQSVQGGLADRFTLAHGLSLTTTALAGVMVLGAIDARSAPGDLVRPFDYGSGLLVSGSASLAVRGARIAQVSVRQSLLHTVTRTPANHALTLYRVEGRLPVARGVSLVVEGEGAARRSTAGSITYGIRRYLELRAGLCWAFGR